MKTVHITWRRVLPLLGILLLIFGVIRNAMDDKSQKSHDRIVRNSRYFTKEKISFNEDGLPGNFEVEEEIRDQGQPGESAKPHHLRKNQIIEEEHLKGIDFLLVYYKHYPHF